MTDDDVSAIREGRYEGFPAPEAALLRLADTMADTPSNVSDALYAELCSYFSVEQLMELTANAALENYRARFNRVFDVGSDGLYRKGMKFKLRGSGSGQDQKYEPLSGQGSRISCQCFHRRPV